ncbi:hypothetical protein M0804_009003 [Polistes exclamans]|nr:hypothetical protein M0804_009003 [Polistes exclamans]
MILIVLVLVLIVVVVVVVREQKRTINYDRSFKNRFVKSFVTQPCLCADVNDDDGGGGDGGGDGGSGSYLDDFIRPVTDA